MFPQRTSTVRMYALLNIHLLTKNRKDIVSRGNDNLSSLPKSLQPSQLYLSLYLRQKEARLTSRLPFYIQNKHKLPVKSFWVALILSVTCLLHALIFVDAVITVTFLERDSFHLFAKNWQVEFAQELNRNVRHSKYRFTYAKPSEFLAEILKIWHVWWEKANKLLNS